MSENYMWLLIEMQDAKQLYKLRRIERNIFADISIDDLTTTKSSKFQNYCDNKSISVIFAALKCVDSILHFWSNKWTRREIDT